MITGIQNVHYFVEDMDRAVAFYMAAFGAELIHQDEAWSSVKIHGLTVGLHATDGGPRKRTPLAQRGFDVGGTLTFRSDDIATDRARLESLGAPVISESKEPWGHLLVFEDLDGHVLNLMKPSY